MNKHKILSNKHRGVQRVTNKKLLEKADKVLFIAHLAIGDFVYLHNFFKAFAERYPHLKIDLWVDEVRRTADQKKWPHLKKYALYDWLETCPFFQTIYRETYSPQTLATSIAASQREQYPVVISLATLRPHHYAQLARKLSPNGYIIGMYQKPRWFQLYHHWCYRALDSRCPIGHPEKHISDQYAQWFNMIGDIDLPEEQRLPKIIIPTEWVNNIAQKISETSTENRIFINPLAKRDKRCWPLSSVVTFINECLQHSPSYEFFVNIPPEHLPETEKALSSHAGYGKQVHLISATENFFQLPALMSQCDIIVSVETATMHLAAALNKPLIALMRQKNPEWKPWPTAKQIIITTTKRSEGIVAIRSCEVVKALRNLSKHAMSNNGDSNP